jgi:alanine-glyoxylate transaminase/serine-glyoxylate transaminase/serine-pyruvate transaminase
MLAINEKGFFPYTPSTNLLQGLKIAIEMLHEEGLDNVFARHDRAAEATRRCVRHWGLDIQCLNPMEYSSSLTAVRLPEGHSADNLRAEILNRFNMSLGNGLGPLADKVFRIGHLGDFHDLMVTGVLTGVEMGLKVCGIPHKPGGVDAAMTFLAGNTGPAAQAAE